jgi:nitroreductase
LAQGGVLYIINLNLISVFCCQLAALACEGDGTLINDSGSTPVGRATSHSSGQDPLGQAACNALVGLLPARGQQLCEDADDDHRDHGQQSQRHNDLRQGQPFHHQVAFANVPKHNLSIVHKQTWANVLGMRMIPAPLGEVPGMDITTVEKLLTSTRSVRKRLDLTREVPLDLIKTCLELAIQAPTGSNSQNWRFVLVTDPQKRKAIADLYAKSFAIYAKEGAENAPKLAPSDPRSQRMMKVVSSAVYLSQNMADVPLFIIPCLLGRVEKATVMDQASFYGSILPAAWSLMLAMRANGLGTAWTTLHLRYEKEVAEILDIPEDFTQTALLPVAYFKGEDFKPAKRVPIGELTYLDSWDTKIF